MTNRYHRQQLLRQIGADGQRRLVESRALVIGCGALGTVMAEHLARAGIGQLRVVDRDVVELSNLQRQTLFTEVDAREGRPKAIAAAERLRSINSDIDIDAQAVDVGADTLEQLIEFPDGSADLIFDGTDNVETRYLINDVAIRHNLPWVYAAAVGVQGRVMAIQPGVTPCLRCIFEQPPNPANLATCDTTGVLAPASSAVASFAVAEGIKLLLGNEPAYMLAIDLWIGSFQKLNLAQQRNPNCPACGQRNFEFLNRRSQIDTKLCGRNAIQLRGSQPVDLSALTNRLTAVANVRGSRHMLRIEPRDSEDIILSIFPDGRIIVTGTTDPARARSLAARYCGR